MNKSSLRTELRRRRRSLSNKEQSLAAELLADVFFQAGLHRQHKRIGCYWPVDGEIDPRPLIERLIKAQKHCFLPIIHPTEDRLVFGEYFPEAKMKENRFGIKEPIDASPSSAQTLDLILIPLVGFDQRGNRLGMGGGFYDRTLAFKLKTPQRPNLIGLAHECQRVEHLETDPWDIPMTGILTSHKSIKIPDDQPLS